MSNIKLGDQVKHRITGAVGIVVGITEWINTTEDSISVQR